eukprot:1154750-Lingulodinium_polyedra.AAC.1
MPKRKPSASPGNRCTGKPVPKKHAAHMKPSHLPGPLMALMVWLQPMLEAALQEGATKDLHSVDLFNGKAANTRGVTAQGLRAVGYDKTY